MRKILSEYEINHSTLAIIPVESKVSKVIEDGKELLVSKSTTQIVDDSCRYFGSSLNGRHEGTKRLIGVNYKSPIIIEETTELIFFPTSSPRFDGCYWIALDKLQSHSESRLGSTLTFISGEKIEINISTRSLENQVLRATKLESVLRKRKIF